MSNTQKLTPCHCINMRRAAKHITEYYNQALEPCGLTVSQFSVLWNLDFLEQSNTTALAERVGVDRSTLVRNLKPLLTDGFIEDTAAEGQRNRDLRVTSKGKMALEIAIPLWKTAQKNIASLIGAEKLDDLKDILGRLQGI